VFDKIQTMAPGAIVENKRLGEALAFARELQASYPPNRVGSWPYVLARIGAQGGVSTFSGCES
jgi:hypothetical protein